ncbi:hypothetical protein BHM03_00006365 [Ensete ventricosum]|nr:hypothetical protein BHM03_00006365 [Ensete ventricosum]
MVTLLYRGLLLIGCLTLVLSLMIFCGFFGSFVPFPGSTLLIYSLHINFEFSAEIFEVMVTDSAASSLNSWIGHAVELHKALHLASPRTNSKDAPMRLLEWIDAGVVYHRNGAIGLLRYAAVLASGREAHLSPSSVLVSDSIDVENVIGDSTNNSDAQVVDNLLGKLVSDKYFDGVTLCTSSVVQLTTTFRILANRPLPVDFDCRWLLSGGNGRFRPSPANFERYLRGREKEEEENMEISSSDPPHDPSPMGDFFSLLGVEETSPRVGRRNEATGMPYAYCSVPDTIQYRAQLGMPVRTAVPPKGGRRWLIEGKIDRRGRLRRNREGKKKKRKKRKKKKKRRRKGTSSRPHSRDVTALALSPPVGRPRAIFLLVQGEGISAMFTKPYCIGVPSSARYSTDAKEQYRNKKLLNALLQLHREIR